MTQANILELARQGDVKAITSLMNSQLHLKNVTAKVTLKNGYLRVMLKSVQAPNQQNLVKYVRQEFTGLKPTSITKIKVYGIQKGRNFPSWSQELNIELQKSFSSSLKNDSLVTALEIANFQEVNYEKNFLLKTIYNLTTKQYIAIFILLISLFTIGQNWLGRQPNCVFQSYIQSKNTENCK